MVNSQWGTKAGMSFHLPLTWASVGFCLPDREMGFEGRDPGRPFCPPGRGRQRLFPFADFFFCDPGIQLLSHSNMVTVMIMVTMTGLRALMKTVTQD